MAMLMLYGLSVLVWQVFLDRCVGEPNKLRRDT